MQGLSLTQILIDGAILCAGMSVLILGSLYYNPRLWLQDYPKEIQAKVPPLTPREKRERLIVAALFLVVAALTLINSIARLEAANGGSVSFLTAYLHVFGVLSIFNLFDAVVLDLIILTGFKPKFAMIPGAEGMEYLYHDWGMHLSNFLKGVVIVAVISIPVALIAAL
jgi:hypothetical protein